FSWVEPLKPRGPNLFDIGLFTRDENRQISASVRGYGPSFDTLLTLAEAPANGRILHKSSHTDPTCASLVEQLIYIANVKLNQCMRGLLIRVCIDSTCGPWNG